MGDTPATPDPKAEARRLQKKKDFRSLFQAMVDQGSGLIQFQRERGSSGQQNQKKGS